MTCTDCGEEFLPIPHTDAAECCPGCGEEIKRMTKTLEQMAEELAKRLSTECLVHPFELSALAIILATFRAAVEQETDALNRRVRELDTQSITLCETIRRMTEESRRYERDIITLTARVKELEEENVCLREDKKRLDWLQEGHGIVCLSKPDTGQGYLFSADFENQDWHEWFECRQAIDAAKAQP